jgi:hypothetical protein
MGQVRGKDWGQPLVLLSRGDASCALKVVAMNVISSILRQGWEILALHVVPIFWDALA